MSRLANPELAERRRRQILDAALACFRRRGFHQTSMSEICTEADISAGARPGDVNALEAIGHRPTAGPGVES